jgi:branched-subunit amino acid ABC-type transport system permease component
MSYYVQLLLNGIAAGAVYALFAVGLTMVYGVFRFINFSHAELITWGAYLALMFSRPPVSWPLYLAAVPAVILTVAFGLSQEWLVYRPLRRRAGPIALLIASIGLSYLLRNVLRLVWGSDLQGFGLPAARGIEFGGYFLTEIQLLTAATAVFFLAMLYLLLTRSLLGKSLRATSDNPELAEIMGVHMGQVSATVWILASSFAAVGGLLLACDTSLEPSMGVSNLIKAFAAVLLAGAGNVWGALIGGLIIGVAENLSVAVFSPGYKDFIAFGMIFLLLLFKPRGIFGAMTGVR